MCFSAPASTTLPSLAWMTPLLATDGATSAARPPSATVSVPSLTIWAPGFGAWSMTILPPAMNFRVFSGLMPEAVTTRPAAFTCEPRLKATPDWFISTIWPLADILPAICDGSGPTTRFSVTDWADGCLKVTVCCAPTSKLCQFTAPRWLPWVTVVFCGFGLAMLTWPPTTIPPCGPAFGAGGAAAAVHTPPGAASTMRMVACRAVVRNSERRSRRTQPTTRTPRGRPRRLSAQRSFGPARNRARRKSMLQCPCRRMGHDRSVLGGTAPAGCR